MNKVGIIGGSGFAGEELIKLLSLHDSTSLIAISSRELKNTPVSDLFQGSDLNFVDPEDKIFFQCDVVFFATPHGTAMDKANSFIQKGIKVIDLSADFRLKDPSIWKEWYGSKHRDLENLKNSIYGLTELNAEMIETSNLIAVPGCYPTASILGLLPLVKNKLPIDSIIIDAKSGISGAGRTKVNENLKDDIHENFRAYATGGHRHLPEIIEVLEGIYGSSLKINFLPHLIPAMRGIYSTIYVNFEDAQNKSIEEIYRDFYQDSLNIELMLDGQVPEILKVAETNNCQIGIYQSAIENQIVIISAIDNLVKGAAGQAIECYNLITGNYQLKGINNG
jgi:N-acetyl-gamma-glutamyl-phosphate reductase